MVKARFNTFPPEWRKIVSKWAALNLDHLKATGELPATFVENSNSALFSVAASRSGHRCLCEVPIERRISTGGRPRKGNGRFDIQLHLEKSLVVIEAKQRHFTLGSGYSLRQGWMRRSIYDVADAVENCSAGARKWDVELGGVVFFSAIIPRETHCRRDLRLCKSKKEDLRKLIADEISAFAPCLEEAPRGFEVLGGALYENGINHLIKDWDDVDWPALFGMVGILKNKRP